ncbi:MAG: HEAT repeat domain-containing protein [Myxococcota bacterium]
MKERQAMDPQLRTVLQRVTKAQSSVALSDADREVVRRAIAHGAEPEQQAQPLWTWCRESYFRFEGAVEHDVLPYFDQRADGVLIDAGARPEALDAPLARMTMRVDRTALIRTVRRQLADKDAGNRQFAAQLVGCAALDELAALVEDALRTDQEQQRDNRSEVVAAMLNSLSMLGSPVAREQGLRFLGSPDRTIQSAAERAMLIGGGPLDDQSLERLAKGKLDASWFRLASADIERAFTNGWLGATAVEGWLGNNWRPPHELRTVGRSLVAARHEAGFKILCEANSGLAGGAWAAAFGDNAWTLPVLVDCHKTASPGTLDARIAMTAIGSHDFAALPGYLESEHQAEGILGVLGWRDRREEAIALLDSVTPNSTSARVVAEFVRASLAATHDAEQLEHAWWRLMNVGDEHHVQLALRAFDAYGWPIPEAVELWRASEEPLEVPSREQLARWVDLTRRDPTVLLRKLRDHDGSLAQWRRSAALIGMSGNSEAIAYLQQRLRVEDNRDACMHAVRALAAAGVDATRSVQARLCSSDGSSEAVLDPADVGEALVASMDGYDMGRVAGASLKSVADRAAPFLRWQLAGGDSSRCELAVATAARLRDPADPHLRDIAMLTNSEAKHISELASPELLLASAASDVREMLATLVGRPPHQLVDVAPLLLPLMNDEDEGVAWAALSSLAKLASGAPWVTDLILERSQADHWEAARRSTVVMASAPHPRFIARLAEIAGDSDDYSAQINAVTALTRVADDFPDRGLVVLDVRQPNYVQERYGVPDEIDWNADRHSEATRLLLVAFDRRRREDLARKHKGDKVLLAAPDEVNEPNPNHIDGATFEGLAMYLGVVFADEDSGSIIAEVREEPSGEILNALLQTRVVAVARASWS